MRLTASDFYSYFQPETCETRVYLKAIKAEASELSPYAQILIELGLSYEQDYLKTLTDVLDLGKKPREEREAQTKSAVESKVKGIYQGALKATVKFGSTEVEVVGDPDFIILEENGYVIRDLKLSRRITEEDHPEILLQLNLYGWLFEKSFGIRPVRLEVLSGAKEFVRVPYDGGTRALNKLQRIFTLKSLQKKPYSPVGWSKCSPCGYKNICWKAAEESRDVALVYGVDQNLTRALRAQGIETYDQLLEKFDPITLGEFKKPWGMKTQRVGKAADSILKMARALKYNKEFPLSPVEIPESENYVMFDLEGLPPQMDELQKIYLWGTQVYGAKPGAFLAATADVGVGGDESGWTTFLKNADRIFGEFGNIPFIHWHHYEKTNVKNYIERFGDPHGIADRVLENMVDLLPLVKKAIALPLPSYSLKAVEKYVGFTRSQTEFGGDWSMAKYIRAIETNSPQERQELLGEILTYNREDLAATWAVFEWFKSKHKLELEKSS